GHAPRRLTPSATARAGRPERGRHRPSPTARTHDHHRTSHPFLRRTFPHDLATRCSPWSIGGRRRRRSSLPQRRHRGDSGGRGGRVRRQPRRRPEQPSDLTTGGEPVTVRLRRRSASLAIATASVILLGTSPSRGADPPPPPPGLDTQSLGLEGRQGIAPPVPPTVDAASAALYCRSMEVNARSYARRSTSWGWV